MPEKHTAEEIHSAMFMGLVMMMNSSAMQQLGKLVNPSSGKTEIDLQGAQMSIDMLMMLQAKTRGNLGKDEEKMLASTLTALQMNYFETASAQKSGTETPAPESEKTAGADEAETQPDTDKNPAGSNAAPDPAASKAAKDAKDPKYHKSYG